MTSCWQKCGISTLSLGFTRIAAFVLTRSHKRATAQANTASNLIFRHRTKTFKDTNVGIMGNKMSEKTKRNEHPSVRSSLPLATLNEHAYLKTL